MIIFSDYRSESLIKFVSHRAQPGATNEPTDDGVTIRNLRIAVNSSQVWLEKGTLIVYVRNTRKNIHKYFLLVTLKCLSFVVYSESTLNA